VGNASKQESLFHFDQHYFLDIVLVDEIADGVEHLCVVNPTSAAIVQHDQILLSLTDGWRP
jgi:hypothetical protein